MKTRLKENLTTASEQLINLWTDGKSVHTADYYYRVALQFMEFVGKPLHLVSLAEVQAFAHNLEERGIKASTRRTAIAAVKSLLSFGHKIGVLPANVGAIVKPPKAPDCLHQRLLSEMEVQGMFLLETHPRNRALLRLLYYGGLRVSELCALKWDDIDVSGSEVRVTVTGKGIKTRTVLVPLSVGVEVLALQGDASTSEPMFRSRQGDHFGHLARSRVYQIVKAAAQRAGIKGNISPHWLRHAHASHAIQRGAKLHLVCATLGHSSLAVTGRYLHARPDESSGLYLPT